MAQGKFKCLIFAFSHPPAPYSEKDGLPQVRGTLIHMDEGGIKAQGLGTGPENNWGLRQSTGLCDLGIRCGPEVAMVTVVTA